jgi:hypothetical protein
VRHLVHKLSQQKIKEQGYRYVQKNINEVIPEGLCSSGGPVQCQTGRHRRAKHIVTHWVKELPERKSRYRLVVENVISIVVHESVR